MKRNRQSDSKDLSKKIFIGVFAAALILGAVLLVKTFNIHSFMTWTLMVWTAFFALTLYCFTDEARYARYERYLAPVIFGILTLFLVVLGIVGTVRLIRPLMEGTASASVVAGGIIGAASCWGFAYIFIRYYVLPFFRDKDR